MSVTADDVRRAVKRHPVEQGQRAFRVVDGEAVVPRHGVAERNPFRIDLRGEGNLLRGQPFGRKARRREIRRLIYRVSAHRCKHVPLMIAADAFNALRTEQVKHLFGARAQIHLIAKRNDPVRLMAADRRKHSLERRQIGMYIRKQSDAHIITLPYTN